MKRVSRQPALPPGRPALARVCVRWLLVATLAVVAAAVGATTNSQRVVHQPSAPVGVAAHLGSALDAVVTPVATVAAVGHSQTLRPLPAGDAAVAATALLLLALTLFIAHPGGRRAPARAVLPPRRGPPHHLLSR